MDITLQEIHNLFRAADQDKNGYLSHDEIKAIMTQIKNGIPPNPDEVARCLHQMDTDGDGVVNEDEFVSSMAAWLGLNRNQDSFEVSKKKRSPDNSPDAPTTRKQAISEMTNFFRQFSPISDFSQQQSAILNRKSTEINIEFIRREYPVLSNEEKAIIHSNVTALLLGGRKTILEELFSIDWNVVFSAVVKVYELLYVVEAFNTSQERLDLIVPIIQIFEGITEVDNRNIVVNNVLVTSIVRRLCTLVTPDVPSNMNAIYIPCLNALHNYILGPGVACTQDSIWYPEAMLTKQVVESERLPLRLLQLLQKNDTITKTNQDIIRGIIRCVGAFAERSVGSLECILRLGFRLKIIALLQQNGIQLVLLRSLLATLGVLCGHTHTFQLSSDIPAAVQFTEIELFDILYCQHKILECLKFSGYNDECCIVHIAVILRYLLPLCNFQDALYKSLVSHLLDIVVSVNSSTEFGKCLILAIDACLEELISIPQACNEMISHTHLLVILQNQLVSVSGNYYSEIATASLKVLIAIPLKSLLFVLRTQNCKPLMHQIIISISSPEVGGYAVNFVSNSIENEEITSLLAENGLVDALFALFGKFKSHTNVVSQVLGTYVGPLFNTSVCLQASNCLTKIIDSYSHICANLFLAEHLDAIGQLHSVICRSLENGLLSFSEELLELTDSLLGLVDNICTAHKNRNSTTTSYICQLGMVISEDWNTKLNDSFNRGKSIQSRNSMELDNLESSPVLCSSSGTFVITMHPTWTSTNIFGMQHRNIKRITIPSTMRFQQLHNGVCSLYATNVDMYYESPTKQKVPITDESSLFLLFEQLRQSGVSSIDIALIPTPNNSFQTVQLGLHKDAIYAATNLQPKTIAMLELRQTGELLGKKIDSTLMSAFYDYFKNQNCIEINIDQFVAAMTSPQLNFNEQSARAIFSTFDIDRNGTLSLKEIGVGFAILMTGSADEKLRLIFDTYDTDGNGTLDRNELLNMIYTATGASLAECSQHVNHLLNTVDENHDGVLDFREFSEAAYRQLIPLGMFWCVGSPGAYIEAYQEKLEDINAKRRGEDDESCDKKLRKPNMTPALRESSKNSRDLNPFRRSSRK